MSAPVWVAYNGTAEGGRCDVYRCTAPAVFARVRLDFGLAFSLLRVVCREHLPADVVVETEVER